MFKLVIIVFIILLSVYYIDIINKVIKEERDKERGKKPNHNYEVILALVPFFYWLFPLPVKKRSKRKSNSINKKN